MSHADTWMVAPEATNAIAFLSAATVNAAGPVTLLATTVAPTGQGCGYKLVFTGGTAGTIAGAVITGIAGQFSCTANVLALGMSVTISGTLGGTGTITGYSSPTTYYIIATNGTTTFTLSTTPTGAGVATTTGTPTGLTYTLGNAAATYTIVGEVVGQPTGTTTEVVAAATGTTVNSTKYYATITSITVNGPLTGTLSIGTLAGLALPRTRVFGVNYVGTATAGTVVVSMAGTGQIKVDIDTPASATFAQYVHTGKVLLSSPNPADYALLVLTNVTFCTLICG